MKPKQPERRQTERSTERERTTERERQNERLNERSNERQGSIWMHLGLSCFGISFGLIRSDQVGGLAPFSTGPNPKVAQDKGKPPGSKGVVGATLSQSFGPSDWIHFDSTLCI